MTEALGVVQQYDVQQMNVRPGVEWVCRHCEWRMYEPPDGRDDLLTALDMHLVVHRE